MKINKVEYEVLELKEGDTKLANENWIGACDEVSKIIYMRKGLPKPVFRKVLTHEVTHAFIREYNMFKDSERTKWSEEDLCVFMENYAEDILNEVEKYMKGR